MRSSFFFIQTPSPGFVIFWLLRGWHVHGFFLGDISGMRLMVPWGRLESVSGRAWQRGTWAEVEVEGWFGSVKGREA